MYEHPRENKLLSTTLFGGGSKLPSPNTAATNHMGPLEFVSITMEWN